MVADFRPWPGSRAPIAGTPHQRPRRIGLHISFYALEGESSKGGNWTEPRFLRSLPAKNHYLPPDENTRGNMGYFPGSVLPTNHP